MRTTATPKSEIVLRGTNAHTDRYPNRLSLCDGNGRTVRIARPTATSASPRRIAARHSPSAPGGGPVPSRLGARELPARRVSGCRGLVKVCLRVCGRRDVSSVSDRITDSNRAQITREVLVRTRQQLNQYPNSQFSRVTP